MSTRVRTAAALCAAVALTVSGCTASVLGSDRSGDIIVVALAEAPDALDPTTAGTFVGRIVFANMCEKLYDADEDLELIPQLAADLPEISEDGKTYTIPLRADVLFNDGTPFNAEAVKISLDRHRTLEESSRKPELSPVETVEVVDELTVRLHLSSPFAPLTSILADRAGMIMSPAQLEELGEDFSDHPVCVGPFSFDSRPSADEINLVKSEFYYDADEVSMDGVTFRVAVDSSVRVADLRAGDVDIVDRVEPPDLTAVQNDSDTYTIEATSLGYQSINLNTGNVNGSFEEYGVAENPFGQHPELREAFELSLDREVINEVIYLGQYQPGCTPVPPTSPWAVDIECSERDIDRARELVEESGVPTPIKVPLMVGPDALNIQLGTIIQAMAKEAGFDVEVQPTEFTTSLTAARAGDFTAFQIGWSGRLDPDQNMFNMWAPGSGLNFSGANFPEVNALMVEVRTTVDEDRRHELYQELISLMVEKRAIIYLFHLNLALGLHEGVSGVEYSGDGLIRLKNAELAEG